MRILFVDDEEKLLQGISRSLFDIDEDWEHETALGGAQALALMEEEPFDVVVSDMRMPGMDGAQLLGVIHDKYPDAVRIILSGHSEQEAAMRAATVAHQFLSKPCSGDTLVEVIKRAQRLRDLVSGPGIRDLVGDVTALPPVPRIFKEMTELLQNPDAGIRDVATLVVQDPALSAKCLQLVNSSFFSAAVAISNPEQAVMRLGLTTVKGLALSAGVFANSGPFATVDVGFIETLQRQGLQVGTLARALLGADENADDAFLCGLMTGVGELIIHAQMRDAWDEVQSLTAEEGLTPVDAQRIALDGETYGHVGAYLLGTWGLPYRVVEAIAFHADPEALENHRSFDLTAALRMAASLCIEASPDTELAERIGVDDRLPSWRAQAAELTGSGSDGAAA